MYIYIFSVHTTVPLLIMSGHQGHNITTPDVVSWAQTGLYWKMIWNF